MNQTVTVQGQDDNVDDGDAMYQVVLAMPTGTDGSGYLTSNPADVTMTNDDNDAVGYTISVPSGHTTELGMGSATFTVRLNAQPTGTVIIGVASADATEGVVTSPTGPASLTFDSTNWNMNQTVTVQGQDDNLDDGDVMYQVVLGMPTGTDGSGYLTSNPADVTVTNDDNDALGYTVSLISGHTTEAGGTATYTIRLNTIPNGTVVIGVASDDATEGAVTMPTGPASLTFDSTNWNMNQTVTVQGQNDALVDGNITYNIVNALPTGTDSSGYLASNPPDVSVINDDDDVATDIRLFEMSWADGDVGNRAAADLLCSGAAPGWAAGRTVRTLISLSATDEIRDMPANYSIPTNLPIYGPNGSSKIADDWADLLDGTIDMSLSAAGAATTNHGWWSFSNSDGSLTSSCQDGTSNSGAHLGRIGFNSTTVFFWISDGDDNCDQFWHLICVVY
jgi:hypothetical protein